MGIDSDGEITVRDEIGQNESCRGLNETLRRLDMHLEEEEMPNEFESKVWIESDVDVKIKGRGKYSFQLLHPMN